MNQIFPQFVVQNNKTTPPSLLNSEKFPKVSKKPWLGYYSYTQVVTGKRKRSQIKYRLKLLGFIKTSSIESQYTSSITHVTK